MANIIEMLEKEEIARLGKTIPNFAPGDTVVVGVNVVEGTRKRVQAYEGVVIAIRNRGLNSSFIVISGNSYCMQRYNFSSVFNFMCGQSLQAQLFSGGAGIKVFEGFVFCISCKIPVSVATIYSDALFVCVYFNNCVVLPI